MVLKEDFAVPSYLIQRQKKPKGVYISIIETFFDSSTRKRSSRTVKSYGYEHECLEKNPNFNAEIERDLAQIRANPSVLVPELRKELDWRIYPEVQGGALGPQDKTGTEAVPRFYYGDVALRTVWEELGLHKYFKRVSQNSKKITYDLDLALFYLVACRVLSPSSKRRAKAIMPQFFFDYANNLTLDNLYDALGQVASRQDKIYEYLNNSIDKIHGRDTTLVFYDVTTFYFESFEPDELRQRGMSKDRKTHETQVVLGLLIDNNGIPLAHELFPGNTAEMGTLLKVVNAYRESAPEGRIVVVADRGLNSRSNLSELRKHGCDYIVAYSLHRLTKREREDLLSDDGWKRSFDRETGELKYKIKVVPHPQAEGLLVSKRSDGEEDDDELALTWEAQEATQPDVRLIVTWSQARYKSDMTVLNEQLLKSQTFVNQQGASVNSIIGRGSRLFVKKKGRGKDEYEINRDKFNKRQELAGYYGIVTSCSALEDEAVYAKLRELWQIEENFRVMKSLLESRPIYVWTPDSIRGHFITCVLALTIERLLHLKLRKNGLDWSFDRISQLLMAPTLSPIITSNPKTPENLYLKTTVYEDSAPEAAKPVVQNLSNDFDKLMQALGIEPLMTIDSLTDIRRRLKVRLPLANHFQ